MSKQITSKELAEIVNQLLTDTQATGELDSQETFQAFMTDIAQVVCDHCGGEIHHPADQLDDVWYIGIHGNDSLPSAFGGIWREYDKEGTLFDDLAPPPFDKSSGWNAFYIVPALTDQAGQCRIVTRRVDNKIDAADSYRASPELWAEAGLMSSSGKLVCLNDPHAFTAMAECEPLSAGVQFNFPINGE